VSLREPPHAERMTGPAVLTPPDRRRRAPGPLNRPGPVAAALVFASGAASMSGGRARNEDAGLAGPWLLAVADGVGGKPGGAVSASVAIARLARDLGTARADGEAALRTAVAAANDDVGGAAAARPELAGMATTLTAVALTRDDRLVVAHVGDARAYLVRDGGIRQLTRDHTLVQGLLDAGVITAEQARTHPLRCVVLSVLAGSPGDAEQADVSISAVRPGDRLLVCSDGLSGVVPAQEILRVLSGERRPSDAATHLLRSALAAGTRDNVTAVVGDVVLVGPAPAAPAEVVGAALGGQVAPEPVPPPRSPSTG
jgi:PPM family protein phosphatase